MKQILLFLVVIFNLSALHGEDIIYRIGKGTLEENAFGTILKIEGTPRERGMQHGILLKEKIQQNIADFIDGPQFIQNPRVKLFNNELSKMLPHIPPEFFEEMEGLAEGAQVPFEKIFLLNLFPEMFHCVGFTVQNEATFDQALYHVRVLDFRAALGIQKSAILMIVKPEGKKAFASIGYAGFIGSVSGMNEKKIAMGEIGGEGYGNWEGLPMAFLIRKILENAESLEQAKEILESTPRTCEYYYVISDGKEEKALGFYATASQLQTIQPGTSFALMAPQGLPKNYGLNGNNDKFFVSGLKAKASEFQTQFYDQNEKLIGLLFHQLDHTLVMKGYGYPERYPVLMKRIQDLYGKIDVEHLQEMIKAPVTNETNIHNVIFRPSTLDMWVSHAGLEGNPASEQPYFTFNLGELLQ